MLAFDVADSEILRERASAAEVTLTESLKDLAESSDVVLSMVTAASALSVAKTAAGFMRPGTIYADLNSCSPRTKQEIFNVVAESRRDVAFAGVAVMSAVPPWKHRVPMVADGPGAPRLQASLKPYGMRIDVLPGPVGAAAALKMCRSAILKGMEALFLEALLAAESVGVGEQVLTSLDASFPENRLSEIVKYLLGRNMAHGIRRAEEMAEVAATFRELGITPFAAGGAADRLAWAARVCPAPERSQVGSYEEWLRILLKSGQESM